MNNHKEKGELTFKTIWQWLRSDKGKKYSFFIFYIFFFIFIFLILSFKDDQILENKEDTNQNNNQQVLESSLPFNLTNLENNDYTFTYQVLKNQEEKSYLGKKTKSEITLQDDTGIYTYLYQNGSLEPNEELEEYYKLFDIYEIKRIIKNSKYDYKQEYNDGRINYNYLIESGSLANFFEIETIKESSLENEILVETNDKNEIVKITFNVLNLMNSTNSLEEDNTFYKIIITYGEL